MRTSAQGVRRIFNQSDVASSRGSELSPDLQTAAMMQAIQEDFEENKPEDDYDPIKLSEDLYGKKGLQGGDIASNSYFNEPIVEGDLRGNSRAAGDVTPETQQEIVNKIVDVGSKLGMTDYEIAYTLATVRYESGFNPDASAKSTSARGLGQFVNETGKAYGLNVEKSVGR
jgi:hypothetical protein